MRLRAFATMILMTGGCSPGTKPNLPQATLSPVEGTAGDASVGATAPPRGTINLLGDASADEPRVANAAGWRREAYDGPDLAKLVMTKTGELLAIADNGTVLRRASGPWVRLLATGEAAALPVRDLMGFSGRDVWAIAYAGPPNKACGLDFRPGTGAILHYDGQSWRVAKKVDGHKLTGIWGSDSHDVWVSASMDFSWNRQGRKADAVLHFDGVAWRSIAIPGLEQADHVPRAGGVWGTARDDVWIFGGVDATFRFNGREFGPVEVGTASPPAWGLRDDVWFVGGGRVMRWKGGVIHVLNVPCDTGACWRSIAAASTNDLWVAGGDGNAGLVAHGDGDHWTVERMPRVTANEDPTVSSVVFDGERFIALTPSGVASHARLLP